MPLVKSRCASKKCIEKAVSANIKELHNNGTKPRSNKQIIAIAYSGALKRKK